MESIWQAAVKDKEHCIAYVIPIPYADKNPDGSVARWTCERDRFPNEVQTLDWQQVDLGVMHPDAIFTHNPYDGGNLVTSVEGHYYSEELKKCGSPNGNHHLKGMGCLRDCQARQ